MFSGAAQVELFAIVDAGSAPSATVSVEKHRRRSESRYSAISGDSRIRTDPAVTPRPQRATEHPDRTDRPTQTVHDIETTLGTDFRTRHHTIDARAGVRYFTSNSAESIAAGWWSAATVAASTAGANYPTVSATAAAGDVAPAKRPAPDVAPTAVD